MNFGFIGAGNMGGAIIGGMVKGYAPETISVTDMNKELTRGLSESYGVNTADSNLDVCGADFVFLCVKPNVIFGVIDEIKDKISENTTVVSIAAGRSIKDIEVAFGKKVSVVRVMPNTPALVGEGMSAICPNENVDAAAVSVVMDIFSGLGRAEQIPESLMDTVTGISGSSPAYVFMFIEAMADAAVAAGMPRAKAYTFAAQAVLGSAKMVLETGRHPGELKDMVCSPAGTTIDAVVSLENSGFRGSIIDAVTVCIEKSKRI